MAIHAPFGPSAAPAPDRARIARLERDLEEAIALLRRLLTAEERVGLVFPVMDDARRFLARRRRGQGCLDADRIVPG